jgi:V-type H+-transporting ATPase subunit E
MSLDKILQALETEAEHQVATLEQGASTQIEHIRAQAQAEVELVRQKRLAAIQAPLQAEQSRILNKAKFEALQIVLGTREDLLTELFETTAQQLAALSNLEGYNRLLQQLLEEAVATLDGTGPFCLEVQKQDMELVQNIVQAMGLQAVVEGTLNNQGLWGAELGGIVVTTSDGQIRLVNTLEARLERVANLYRSQVAELLFDQPKGE